MDTATTSSTSVEETSHSVSKHWAEEKFSSAPSCSYTVYVPLKSGFLGRHARVLDER